MYKVGDRVRVKTLDEIDKDKGIEIGDIYSIEWIDDEDDDEIGINIESEKKHYLFKDQIEKVEENKEMTFPEMVQKLINGEFKVGTELENGDTTIIHYVLKNEYGYGLTDRINGCLVATKLNYPSYINGTWTVKEQPIKEMSIEELQKELGYKIKIVERESK